ncbi:MAG: hypothetical protein JWP89_2629 [Schlesneria sp.]|nr:hypothetical protein [Schlesneria sp.]
MPRSIHSVLSFHPLISEYRGPRILNEEGVTPPPATPPATPPAGEGATPPATPPTTPAKPPETEGRITELARKNKELQDQLDKIATDKKAADDAKLKEEGKLQELLTQKEKALEELNGTSTSMKTKLDNYEKLAQEQVDSTLKAITDKEKQKTVKDMLEGKPIEEQIAMMPKLLALVGQTAANFGGATPTSTTSPDKTDLSVKRSRHAELIDKTKKGTITGAERGEMHRIQTELSAEFEKDEAAKKAATT